jgi:hypothetical protein
LRIAAALPLAWRLMPPAVGMEPSLSILGSRIAGAEWHGGSSDVQDPLEQHLSALLRPFPHHAGHHEPPYGGTGPPDPGVPLRLIGEPSKRYMVLLGRHKAPEFVELTFNDLEVAPEVQHHQAAVLGRAIQPGTPGLFVDLDDVDLSGSHGLPLRPASPSQKWLGRRAEPSRLAPI